jgi:hypothetical protein
LPPHWRTNKSLPEPFRILSVGPDIPNGTEVVVTAGNQGVPDAQLRNSVATFTNNVAKFNDLRFIGKSGRGMCRLPNVRVCPALQARSSR